MPTTARRVVGLLFAIACVGSAVVVSSQQAKSREALARQRVKAESAELAAKASKALEEQANLLAQRAVSGAATLDNVFRQANISSDADRQAFDKTIVDVIDHEAWWEPYRAIGSRLFFLESEPIEQMSAEEAEHVRPLVRDALTAGQASAVLPMESGPTLAGAGRVPTPSVRQERGVVVFVTPIGETLLKRLAAESGQGVALAVVTPTASVVAGDGAEALQASLATRGSSEDCCATFALSKGVELVARVDPGPMLAEAEAESTRIRVPVFAAALVLAVVGLALGFRTRGEDQDRLLREASAQLQKQGEELQRLSLQISRSGSNPGIVLQQTGGGDDEALASTAASAVQSRYQEIAPLGQGGMARVSVAVLRGAEGFRRYFVVKRLRRELVDTPEMVSQFIDEARLGASLVQSNVVPVFDFGRDADGYYMAQEYILGRDVDTVVQASVRQRGRPLELPLVLTIAQEALKALSYAHAKTDDAGRPLGLVHRDVSPSNLMVSARGEVKLLDFGIVKSDQRLTKTQAGVVKGNLYFMSPEQARGLELDRRSDLFSLGQVIYFAASGETLYSGSTSYELLTRAAMGLTAADWARVDALPSPLPQLLKRALQTDPLTRYGDADEFARAIASSGVVPAASSELQQLMAAVLGSELAEEQARLAPREGA